MALLSSMISRLDEEAVQKTVVLFLNHTICRSTIPFS